MCQAPGSPFQKGPGGSQGEFVEIRGLTGMSLSIQPPAANKAVETRKGGTPTAPNTLRAVSD
jgi:hypothetical protein